MKFILGTKVGMTRVFDDQGRNFAVTKIAALPAEVSQVKDKEKEGYRAVQIKAYKNADKKRVAKIAEFVEKSVKKYKIGEAVTLKQFAKNDEVTVEGTSKGKGFAGTIKRHGFHRGPAGHGSKNVRKPGSIGGGYPERVVLGRKMAGRMGHTNVTVKNLRVIDLDDQYLLISGAIPGANGSIIKVYGSGEKAEEIVDHAAEEELLAQQRMLEADKEAKAAAESRPEGIGEEKAEGTQGNEPKVEEESQPKPEEEGENKAE